MKFARYLQDTQASEWKKAYIDYRGLKKRIRAIRNAREGLSPESSGTDNDDQDSPSALKDSIKLESGVAPIADDRLEPRSAEPPSRSSDQSPRMSGRRLSFVREDANIGARERMDEKVRPEDERSADSSKYVQAPVNVTGSAQDTIQENTKRSRLPRSLPSFRRGVPSFRSGKASKGGVSRPTNPMDLIPLNEILPQLEPRELDFFNYLDAQLQKVESFYEERESEMRKRTEILQQQLDELGDHEKLVQEAHSKESTKRSSFAAVSSLRGRFKFRQHEKAVDKNGHAPKKWSDTFDRSMTTPEAEAVAEKGTGNIRRLSPRNALSTNPEVYLNAKKKLKKAVLEHYRGLQVLRNYCILNRDGFQKALKKFEKATGINVRQQYMADKVYKCAFASDKSVTEMLRRMESLYALRFTRSNQKRATERLRAGFHFKSHHHKVFRSGILLGIALPPLVSGIYASFQQSERRAIPGWDGLLFVYGILLIPVLFSILIGINLLVWARSRINYVFIFQLDTRTRLDYREYHEIPSILLASLCYAFWLSFNRIGAPQASPTIWPLVWLGFCGLIMLNPFPFYKSSRYWLIKNTGKLFLSGARRVEFTDFWMGDQFCSLAFSISNLYLLVCTYAWGFENWTKCTVTSSPNWPVPFVLGSLPFIFRTLQSVKRYHDSGHVKHLINGGKYGTGILSTLFFYIWRYQRNARHGSIFALFLLFNVIYSVYVSAWDFLMDWSVLRWRAPYPLLREELVYTNSIPLYYVAIAINLIIRFNWIIYIPSSGPSINLRMFIVAMTEISRRCLWNFYRLENEHLGNADQYRITQEVPLPYSFDEPRADYATDNDDDEMIASRPKHRRRPRSRRKGMTKTS